METCPEHLDPVYLARDEVRHLNAQRSDWLAWDHLSAERSIANVLVRLGQVPDQSLNDSILGGDPCIWIVAGNGLTL